MAEKQLGVNPANDKDIATKKYVDDAITGSGGDASTNTSSSVVNEVALFADTGGKTLKRATGTGIATLTSGVLSTTSTTGSGNAVLATSPTLVTPALGTPSAVVLTNASGSPTLGTITTTGNIELGHATDTTLSRSSAGVLAVENVEVPTISSASTLTNKRITKRVNVSTAPGATPSLDWGSYDIVALKDIGAAITSMSTGIAGVPTHGQPFLIRMKDDGTPRAITWGASYRAIGVTLPTTTTANKTMYIGGFYNTTDTIYDVLAVGTEA